MPSITLVSLGDVGVLGALGDVDALGNASVLGAIYMGNLGPLDDLDVLR